MFRLIRWVLLLTMLAVLVWFAATVPVGRRTLWAHLRAIFGTREARDLAEGTREEASKVAEKIRRTLQPDAGAHPGKEHNRGVERPPERRRAPLDPIEPSDRRDLDRLVRDKTRRPTRPSSPER